MTIRLRPDSSAAIYEQIAGQVVFAVAGGDLAPGDLIPSVRDLAVQLTVNPNTVTRAFQELERLGVIEPRRGLGMAVTPEAPKLCRDRRKELIRDRVRETIREAASAGLQATDVHKLIDDEWPAAGRNGSKSSR